jgi:AcrR family transcriptional regulator
MTGRAMAGRAMTGRAMAVAGRKVSKAARRLQLIEATIDSLAKRGYAETTLADVADGAGLSRGIVNFHFESKEKLLVATLQHLADEYVGHWQAAVAKAGPGAAGRLWAVVAADFDRRVCTRRKIAAWCAFWGEARSRPTYQALCGARDAKYQQVVQGILAELKAEAGYPYAPEAMALSLCAMLEGLWIRLMLGGGGREQGRAAAVAMLVAGFPRHFGPDGPLARP